MSVTTGETLKQLREVFGLTKHEMAKLVGLKPTTYARREAAMRLEPVEVCIQ
jgi:DNA-binding XRE family transcriptional regulator